jgi:hypothetical protein
MMMTIAQSAQQFPALVARHLQGIKTAKGRDQSSIEIPHFPDGVISGTGKDAPSPCEGCRNQTHCATGHACERFQFWLHRGRRNNALSGVPTAKMFARLFPEVAVVVAAE